MVLQCLQFAVRPLLLQLLLVIRSHCWAQQLQLPLRRSPNRPQDGPNLLPQSPPAFDSHRELCQHAHQKIPTQQSAKEQVAFFVDTLLSDGDEAIEESVTLESFLRWGSSSELAINFLNGFELQYVRLSASEESVEVRSEVFHVDPAIGRIEENDIVNSQK